MPNRAISTAELLNRKFNIMELDGEWRDLLGEPERSGAWLIWGNSGNGKTRFCLSMAKYLTKFGRVAYNTIEEGARLSMQKAVREVGMEQISRLRRPIFLDRESIHDMRIRLEKHKSPDIIFIDSLQYSEMNKIQYKKLKSDFPSKLFILVSHADGKNPQGHTARSIRYDVDVKLFVEGFRVFGVSRLGYSKPFTIWEKGALEYWGE